MVFGMVNALYQEYDCLSLFDTNKFNSDKITLHRFLSCFWRRIYIRIQFCKITTFWDICLNHLLYIIVIDKRKNTGIFFVGYAKDGTVRFSISLPDFAWYLAWSMPSTKSTIVYPYLTLTNWTLTKKRYIGFCRVFDVESISAFSFAKLRYFEIFV